MKRISFLLITFSCCFSAYAQSGKEFNLYVFGSDYSGQTIAFRKDAENNADLKALFSKYNYQYIDADNMKTGDDLLQYMYMYRKMYPYFVVTNSNGDILSVLHGYESSQKLSEGLEFEKIAASQVVVTVEQLDKYPTRKIGEGLNFKEKIFLSKWKLGGGGGVVFSNLSNSLTDYKIGYFTNIYAKYNTYNRIALDMGVSLYSMGGRDSDIDNRLRLNYISVPVNIDYRIWRYLFAGVGVYGSYLLSSDLKNGTMDYEINNIDAGVRLRLLYQMGSFNVVAGYTRGVVNIYPSSIPYKAYNNGFFIGININLGD